LEEKWERPDRPRWWIGGEYAGLRRLRGIGNSCEERRKTVRGRERELASLQTVTERSGLVKAEPKRTQDPKRNKNARIEEDY
jgi:hypothetical protein